MITLFSGTLGSGKSYKMVAELSRCKNEYYIVHNIDLKVENYLGVYGVNWLEYCKRENIEITDFFSKEYQSEYAKAVLEKYNRPVLIIIDEAHEWFDKHVKTFKMWLSYSRHLDQEIWLVAHRSTNIPAIYRSFVGTEYRAKAGSVLNNPWFFLYNRIEGGERAGYTFERKRKEIFALYKSKDVHNKDKKEKRSLMIPVILAFICIGLFMFFWLSKYSISHNRDNKKASSVVSQNNNQNLNSSSNKDQLNNMNKVESFSDKYAYAGSFNDEIVIEERKTGKQFTINRFPDVIKLINYDRDNSCTLIVVNKIVKLFNYDRFKNTVVHSPEGLDFGAGAGGRQQSTPAPANGI